jgi:uncharacterized protein (DUF169 family)
MKNSASPLADLGLTAAPVAVKFLDQPPAGVPRVESVAPSGCTYWKLAAQGRIFYTEAADHHGCPIGCVTHNVELPADKAEELNAMVSTMVQLQYLEMAEVPHIPRRSEPFTVAVYAPWEQAEFDPDVVLIAGEPKQMMLLAEAARAAGVATDNGLGGRPTCAAIPQVMQAGGAALNLACIGNRVYSGLPDDQMYFAVAGSEWTRLVDKLGVILRANQELEKFHLARTA